MEHEKYMQEAYHEALKAYALDETPIGCVIVHDGVIIGRGHNRRATERHVLAHAEIIAIDQACRALGDWRLDDCQLYVTLEPCAMCAGAIVQARVPVVVYGAPSHKQGCAGSVVNLLENPAFNHRCAVIAGVMGEACSALVSGFFTRFRGSA